MDLLTKNVWIQFFLPLFWAVGYYISPINERLSKIYSIVGGIIYFIYTVWLVASVDSLSSYTELGTIKMDHFFGLTYSFGIDGLSGVLILLNAFLLLIVILSTLNFETEKFRLYYFSIFSLTWAVNASLLSTNLFAFFIFWEVMLLPLFILIGVFGGQNKKYASYKFFLFTASGSILMLGSILYMSSLSYGLFNSYDLTPAIMQKLNLPFNGLLSPQALIFWAFCIAFFIKVPVFPFHSWLPDAHVEAPTAGSIILAGILLKLGIYGLLRFVLPVFPQAVEAYRGSIIALGCMGIVYGALTALVQEDIKKVVAFSSISHMGYIVVGIFSPSKMAVSGAIFQMISHGLTTSGLFIAVHCLYVRRHTKMINQYGGVAKMMPLFAVCYFVMTMGSMAVPLTNGFVGEFMITFGAYESSKIVGTICALGVILGPLYLLNLFQDTMLGEVTLSENLALKDINTVELLSFVLIGVLIFLYGVYPRSLISIYDGLIH